MFVVFLIKVGGFCRQAGTSEALGGVPPVPSGLPSAIFESSKGTRGPSKVRVSLQRGFKVILFEEFNDFHKN